MILKSTPPLYWKIPKINMCDSLGSTYIYCTLVGRCCNSDFKMIYNLLFLNIFHLLCAIRSQHEIFTIVKVRVFDHMFCQTKLAARVVYEFDLSSLCVVKFDDRNWAHLKYNIHNLFTAPFVSSPELFYSVYLISHIKFEFRWCGLIIMN